MKHKIKLFWPTKKNIYEKFLGKNGGEFGSIWFYRMHGLSTMKIVSSRPAAVTTTISAKISSLMVLIVAIVVITIVTSLVIVIHVLRPSTAIIIVHITAMIALLLLMLLWRKLLLSLSLWRSAFNETASVYFFLNKSIKIYCDFE